MNSKPITTFLTEEKPGLPVLRPNRSPLHSTKIRTFGSLCLLAAVFATGAEAASVKDFGAAGNGRSDDTEAFEEGIEYAAQHNEPLEIPAGRYLIQDDLQIRDRVEFVGVGHEKSIITTDGDHHRLFIHASGTSFRDIGFEDMVEPIVLKSRKDYELEDVLFERCRFQDQFVTHSNRGVIGLETAKSSERPHIIRNLVIRDSIFRDINAHAINIRANLVEAKILNNQFINLINPRGEDVEGEGGYAIRLGESSDDRGTLELFAQQGHHLIEGNTIRNMRKKTLFGNLKAMLLYGNYNMIRNNLIEDIGDDPEGEDVSAMYIRGAYHQVVNNTIRNILAADDDGAISFKGGLDLGTQHNSMTGNYIENIYGLSAVEASSSYFTFTGNEVVNSRTRGLQQRSGSTMTVIDNIFRDADTSLRTESGEVNINGNQYINSKVIIEERRGYPADRDYVFIHENLFRRTEGDDVRAIILGNGVEERFVSIRDNRFEYPNDDMPNGSVVDFTGNGTVERVEIVNNLVLKNGSHDLKFSVDSPDETVSGNTFGSIDDPAYFPDPSEPAPAVSPADLKLQRDQNELALTWTAEEGLTYQVESSSDLETWDEVGDPIIGEGEEVNVSDLPGFENGATFYRLRVISAEG